MPFWHTGLPGIGGQIVLFQAVELIANVRRIQMPSANKSKAKIKLQPLGDRLVVQREESQERTAGGILLPDSAKDRPTRGKVVAVGDGRLANNGTRIALQVKEGDRVLFTSYAGEQIEVDGEEYLLMGESEVLAVIG
jgi:chaperonin GroES